MENILMEYISNLNAKYPIERCGFMLFFMTLDFEKLCLGPKGLVFLP